MGKRLTQSSLKISKKQPNHQFNSLIKVLKPKVYITNSSNFKTLVQELTGNGSHSSEPSFFSPPNTMHVVSSEPAHVIQIDDHDSPDPSVDNMFMQFDYTNYSSEELGSQWSDHDRSLGSSPDHSLDNMNMCLDDIELRNIESWLLDFDSSACSHDVPFVHMNTYEYEYNLSSIM